MIAPLNLKLLCETQTLLVEDTDPDSADMLDTGFVATQVDTSPVHTMKPRYSAKKAATLTLQCPGLHFTSDQAQLFSESASCCHHMQTMHEIEQ